MKTRAQAFGSIVGLWCVASPGLQAAAQEYPAKPVRILVGFTAASATDVAARVLAQRLNESLGQPAVVENRPGAGGMIALEAVAKAAADGYTLVMTAASVTIQPALRAKLSFQVPGDFSPVSLVANGPYVLVVHPSVPAASARDLVLIAKSKGGGVSYASSGVGSSAHLAGELFNALAKVRTIHVPYKGSPQAALAVATGEVDFNLPSVTAAQPLIDGGRVRALAVSTLTRTALLPSLPTLHESGVPGYDRNGWYGLMAPVGTPRDIIGKLHGAVARAVNTGDMKAELLKLGLEAATNTPDEFTTQIRREVEINAGIARTAGLPRE
jgi:tripartite-type tricarboxylate transporter receptor subunit TctC